MITKQKIKRLEASIERLRGEKIHYVMKKVDEELYNYENKIYYNLDNVKKSINFRPNDILVVIQDYGNSFFDHKNLLK